MPEKEQRPNVSGEVLAYREFFAKEGDWEAFQEIARLREELEPLDGWKRRKELARAEIDTLDPDIFSKLFEKFAPYTETLPPGHGRGHMQRDAINVVLIMQDEDVAKADPAELFVGAVAGVFHDIGNSVVERYDEPFRYSGHAEAGAYLIGKIGKGLIPPNLLSLVQLSIAGHTHYTKEFSVEKDGRAVLKKPYQDEVVDGNRLGMWIPRWTDRLDTNGPPLAVRHIITKAEPTVDFSGGKFQDVWEDPEDDFRHQFSPVVRTSEARGKLAVPQNTTDVLEHLLMFSDSNYNPNLPYPKYDTPYYRWHLMTPLVSWQRQFVLATLAEPPSFTQEEVSKYIGDFLKLCKTLEPGEKIDEKVDLLRRKFDLLDEDARRRWANGFKTLSTIYMNWYGREDELLREQTKVESPGLYAVIESLRKIGISSLFGFMP